MTSVSLNRFNEYRIDQLPDELVDQILTYFPDGDPNLTNIAAISRKATYALTGERLQYGSSQVTSLWG